MDFFFFESVMGPFFFSWAGDSSFQGGAMEITLRPDAHGWHVLEMQQYTTYNTREFSIDFWSHHPSWVVLTLWTFRLSPQETLSVTNDEYRALFTSICGTNNEVKPSLLFTTEWFSQSILFDLGFRFSAVTQSTINQRKMVVMKLPLM